MTDFQISKNMRFFQVTLMMLAGTLMLASCQGQGVKSQKLSPDSYEAKLSSLKDKILIDVRTPDEYNAGHLTNATLINIYDDTFKTQISKLDKTKPVFVYCKAGTRSAKAADALLQLGFTQVYDLEGGFIAWVGANKKISK